MLAAEIENSAGHDSLEMVADFGGGRGGPGGTLYAPEGTHSSSAFVQIVTPRLNTGRDSVNGGADTATNRLNLTTTHN